MPLVIACLIGLVTLVFLGGTMELNYEFGSAFGRNAIEQKLFGWIAVGFDVLKAVLPIVVWSALRRYRFFVALVGVVLWVGCLAISLASAAGVSASVRSRASESAAHRAEAAEIRRANLARKNQRRQEIGSIESTSVVEGRVAELRSRYSWRASKQCTEIANKEQREQCAEVLAASRRLEEAQEASRLDDEIARLAATPTSTEIGGGAVQVDLLARVLGLPHSVVDDGLSMWWVATIEVVACFGLLLATSHAEARPGVSRPVAATGDTKEERDDSQEVGRPLEFAALMLAPQKSARLTYDDAFAAYKSWCSRKGKPAIEREIFIAMLAKIARDVDCWRMDGKRLVGVRVTPKT